MEQKYTDLREIDGKYCMGSAAGVIHTSTCCYSRRKNKKNKDKNR